MSRWTDPLIVAAIKRGNWGTRSPREVVREIKRLEAAGRNARTPGERRAAGAKDTSQMTETPAAIAVAPGSGPWPGVRSR